MEKKDDQGGTSLTEGSGVSGVVPAPQLSHDELVIECGPGGAEHALEFALERGLVVAGLTERCRDCVQGLQPSTHLDAEQPMRLCSTCDGSGVIAIVPREPCAFIDGRCTVCGEPESGMCNTPPDPGSREDE